MSLKHHPPSVARRMGSFGPAIVVLSISLLLSGWFILALVSSSGKITYNQPSQTNIDQPAHTSDVKLHPVSISVPDGPPVAYVPDPKGGDALVAVSCTTCHTTREPNYKNVSSADMDEFHLNMTMAHGNLTCLSCHNPKDYDTLKKADNSPVSYPDVMQLCGQCHQSRYNDYLQGAHGGMTGFWDLSKGPRTRKACIDCHDPHAPAMPKMLPQFKPLDRFMDTPHSSDHQPEASH